MLLAIMTTPEHRRKDMMKKMLKVKKYKCVQRLQQKVALAAGTKLGCSA